MKQKASDRTAVRTSEKIMAERKDVELNYLAVSYKLARCNTPHWLNHTSLSNGEEIRSKNVSPVLSPVLMLLEPPLLPAPVLCRGNNTRAGEPAIFAIFAVANGSPS